MYSSLRLVSIFTAASFLVAGLSAAAQDAKKDDEKKDEKKVEKKVEVKKEEKLVYGTPLPPQKIKRIDGRTVIVEQQVPDQDKILKFQQWAAQQQAQLAQTPPQQRFQRQAQFQQQYAQKARTEIYSLKEVEFVCTDNCKIRAMTPPFEYDETTAKPKVWTKKQLDALKAKDGNMKLPGYMVSMEDLRPGQMVQIYPQKLPPAVKTVPKKKDEPAAPEVRPEVVMLVVVQDIAQK